MSRSAAQASSQPDRDASSEPLGPREPVAAVLLGAGLGTRMKSSLPKVLHQIAGRAMIAHVLSAVAALRPSHTVVVAGPDTQAAVGAAVDPTPVAVQAKRLGTAHAVLAAQAMLSDVPRGTVFVLFGDTPFIRPGTLRAMAVAREAGAGVVVLGFRAADPTNYGRLILDRDGVLRRIVEHRDADAAERAVDLCNAGVMAIAADRLVGWLERIGNDNAKGEYYLTDIVGLALADGARATVIEAPEDEVMGIDSKADLADAEARWQRARRTHAMVEEGAILADPETVWFSWDTALARDVSVGQMTVFGPGVTVEEGAVIKPFCHLEGCTLRTGATIGPYARIRAGSDIGEGARIGNFVETKNARFAAGAKANHLSYIGDAEIGAEANIGAGTITCNYDGYLKHRTIIGPKAFIGSNSALVAPLTIGAGAIVAAGSTLTGDVGDDGLALARARQEVKPGRAKAIHEIKAAEKAARRKP